MVYLVGGGPGDPKLLTLRGREALALADVVVYDALINEALLSLAPKTAEIVFVGKRAGWHSASQDEISARLVDLARAGKNVVRLKGGDPFLFGRGGEEASALAQAGVAFEVVPGVPSALAAPAYAGIPLTHRALTRSVTICTGHAAKAGAPPLDFAHLARLGGTLVFLMGRKFLAENTRALLAAGVAPSTPAAVIEWGTLPRQRAIFAPLSAISDRCDEARVEAPATLVVGEVAALGERLSWYTPPPLAGRRIVITRAAEQAGDLAARLSALGAEPVSLPTIALGRAWEPAALSAALRGLARYDYLLFTSANAVRFFFEALAEAGKDARALAGPLVAAIGAATAEKLRAHGVFADLVAKDERAEGLLDALPASLEGKRVLLPRAKKAREVLPETLRARGAALELLTLYETRAPEGPPPALEAADAITFTSGSTVENFLALYPPGEGVACLRRLAVVAIGPVTAEALTAAGVPCRVAPKPSVEGLVEALLAALGPATSPPPAEAGDPSL